MQDWFDVGDGIGKAAKFFVNISENVKLEKLAKAPAYVVQLCEGCNNKNSEEKQKLQTIYMWHHVLHRTFKKYLYQSRPIYLDTAKIQPKRNCLEQKGKTSFCSYRKKIMTSFSTRPYSNHLRGLVSLIVTPIVLHLLAVWSKYGLDKKPPKKLSGLPVLHFAGGLIDCFQKKTSTFFTLYVHFRFSPEYMLIATVDKQTRKLNI